MMLAFTDLDLDAISARWWMLVVRGIAAILFGALALMWPGISLLALVFLWGAYAMADGVFGLMLAAGTGAGGGRWGWLLLEGLLGIGAGLVAFIWPGMTALVLLVIIAFWAVLTGIAEIVAAVELRRVVQREWILALSGILSIAFGVLMLLFPRAGALAFVMVIGVYATVFGALLVGLGVRLHRLTTSRRHAMTRGAPSHA